MIVDFKYWTRSRSLRFMRDRKSPRPELHSFRWNGHPVHYRAGTSDMEVLYRILLKPEHKREYRLPAGLKPRVILDIGANIGATTLLYAKAYPSCVIHSFEPVPANLELLHRNVAPYLNVRVHGYALGAADETRTIYYSDDESNLGGFSFHDSGVDKGKSIALPLRNATRVMNELGVHHVDLIKIDTEGSEFEILTAFPPRLLQETEWLCGELHGNRDFALLDHLSPWFDFSFEKKIGNRLMNFEGRNRRGN